MSDNALTGENDVYEGYDDRAARVQLQYENDNFSALFNAHARNLDGTARVFRANIIESGSNNLVDGFDPDKVSFDGQNRQELNIEGGSVRLSWDFGDLALYSITGYESMDAYSRGDIDGGFGCGFCGLPNGPGFIPFPSETADGIPTLDQFTAGNAPGIAARPAHSTGRPACTTSMRTTTPRAFGYDSLAGGVQNQYLRSNQTNKAWAVFGSVNYKVTAGIRAARRRSLHERRQGFRHRHARRVHVSRSDAAHHRAA